MKREENKKGVLDKKKLFRAAELIIEGLGEDIKREGLTRTPLRVAKDWPEMFDGYGKEPEDVLNRTFDAEGYDEMIIIADIKVESFCEHHILPFRGKAWLGYIPDKRIIGLDKVHKLVRMYSHRLQNQERLTKQVANAFQKVLEPQGVMVVIKAFHDCMRLRGVRANTGETVTSVVEGDFRKEPIARTEFLRLIGQ